MKEFQTNRIKLVAPNLKYLEDFYHYAQKPNIGPMAGWLPHSHLSLTKAVLEDMKKDKHTWFIIWQETDRMIGTIDLTPDYDSYVFKPTVYELGYSIDDEFWGMGIAVEACNLLLDYAFQELKVKEVIAKHSEQNFRSKRVLEKLGFEFTSAGFDERYKQFTFRVWNYKMTKYHYDRRR